MRRVVLLAVYLLVVTPAGLASRLIRDPLTRRTRRCVPSYWVQP
ncbi:hypothetical protein [Streptomyces sp. NBC_00154]|nr:hypothetical protein [Streptomyces sp. NBC_00154]MCX5313052.1 hypothetical protein [Streptomyces sp. NBC_00154]